MNQLNLGESTNIQALAKRIGIHPTKLRAQHFLVDENILSKTIEHAHIEHGESILEIGPGFGVLTRELLRRGARVLAVEQDKKLSAYLREEFGDNPNLQVKQDDILNMSNQEISKQFSRKPYRVISNIPYNITGKIIKKFVSESSSKPSSMLIMIQKEVAKRICAKAGDMSLLSLSVQLYSDPEILFNVPKDSFWPVPKVESSSLFVKNIKIKPRINVDEKRFWRFARIGFASPRKQLRNNLVSGLHISSEVASKALTQATIPEKARAQELSIEQWIELIQALERN
jgi:16S rRNA (adenine1518-N6/adenine1519-N6)-dimethyltransferase